MGGLIKWAKHKAGATWKEALGLARTAWNYAQHLAALLSILFGDVRGAWGDMVSAGLSVGRDLAHLARESFVALRWLYRTVIPKAIRHALSVAYTYARKHVASAVHHLEHLIGTEVARLRKAASTLRHDLTHWIARIRQDVHDALSLGRKAFALADQIANHPGAFAESLVSYLAEPLARYVLKKLPTLLVWFGRHAVPLIKANAPAVEAVLTDLL